jgi:hypothetical protein
VRVEIAEDGLRSALRWLSYWDSMWEIMMIYVSVRSDMVEQVRHAEAYEVIECTHQMQ